jgi:hypothetical protein
VHSQVLSRNPWIMRADDREYTARSSVITLAEIVGNRNQSLYVRRRLAIVTSRRKCRQSISMGFSHEL